MKIRNWISLGLVVSTAAFAIACGGKDNNGDGDGDSGDETEGDGGQGNYSNDFLAQEIEDLKKQIADLEDQLENAQQEEIPDLQDELDAANDRLDELETCANGGECNGVDTALALTVYSDAYCASVFGCCSADEARATLGQGASDEASCKNMFAQLLVRGNAVPNAPGMGTFDSYTFGQLAAALQTGRIELDSDALEECAGGFSTVCLDAEPTAPPACMEAGESACDRIFVGLQEEGESCGSVNECKDGLFCLGGAGGYADGVCVVEPKVDDFCQRESDCTTSEGDLYCDESAGTCQQSAAEGDDCEFADPTFNSLSPDNLTVPCLPGLWCSPESSTCVATCDKLKEGDVCNNSDQCEDNTFCDLTELEDQQFAGLCTEQLDPGAASDVAEACKSGKIFADITDSNYNAYNCQYYLTDCVNTCAGMGGDSCEFDDLAGADCNSNSCNEASDKCRTKCDEAYGNTQCADDETCKAGVCYESVTSNSDCLVTEQCPDSQFCDTGTGKCANRVGTGDPDDVDDDCTVDEECKAGSACEANINGGMDCRPYGGLGSGEYCTAWYHCSSGRCEMQAELVEDQNTCKAASSLGEAGDDCDMEDLDASDINQDPCGAGLFCKRSKPYSTSDFTGTCTEQLAPGAVCDQSLPGNVNQCTGNTVCASSPAAGVLSCPVAYSEPEQNDKCVFGTSTFATSVAYGDFPIAVPVR